MSGRYIEVKAPIHWSKDIDENAKTDGTTLRIYTEPHNGNSDVTMFRVGGYANFVVAISTKRQLQDGEMRKVFELVASFFEDEVTP